MDPIVEHLADGIARGQLRSLAKAITLVESKLPEHNQLAGQLLEKLLPFTGNALRIGITGVPGVGKSTFIEAFGLHLIERGHKVAVLAVDPSSQITGGSILGDKTRMELLSRETNAYIRPSPAGETLGGVARKTREAMLICEAYGFDVVLVETVGVGQSEVTVAQMVDFFLLLQLPNAGDELQGIKKGVMELADGIIINKADGDNQPKAQLARAQIVNALHILSPRSPNWQVPVLLASGLAKQGIDAVWDMLGKYRSAMMESGEFQEKRSCQVVDWMWSMLMDEVKDMFVQNRNVASLLPGLREAVHHGVTTPGMAVKRLIEAYRRPLL
ncbi:methylmalonyl Co-A mutase-associated GTPase MeaB [Chrysiogenes arsenatis]|uniref:methylmalonyl Co-A mutase-associated GTPase MeaB n=1 Tax=Chrysiogenes arsenatis TaxID=309797 RepID=UPI0003F5489B|nr:methylmalonyl Co-A mutase-associated GTPase MeaB [Chrysiogenes arsenatis]